VKSSAKVAAGEAEKYKTLPEKPLSKEQSLFNQYANQMNLNATTGGNTNPNINIFSSRGNHNSSAAATLRSRGFSTSSGPASSKAETKAVADLRAAKAIS